MTSYYVVGLRCSRILKFYLVSSIGVLCLLFLVATSHAQTYNLSNAQYPPCSSSWTVSGTVYTCTGNGRVTLPSGAIVTANAASTINANNGFSLTNNTLGSASIPINLQSTYGSINTSGSEINGSVSATSGAMVITNSNVRGGLTTAGNINLTGGGVTGLVTSTGNTIIANDTNFGAGARANSGMVITGGVLVGSFSMSANNQVTFTGVTMISGSITGASNVNITNSLLGSSSALITITSNSGEISLNNSTVYGNLTAPNYSTVRVANNSAIYGTCLPNSTPANACSPVPPVCSGGGPLAGGIVGQYFNNTTLSGAPVNTRLDSQINFDWVGNAPGVAGVNADQFSVRWEGLLRTTQAGNYRFQTASDDGVRLWVNGVLVINNWTDHSNATDTSGFVALAANEIYSIRLEFYENGGNALMRLRWLLPGSGTYQPIPAGTTPAMGAGLYHCSLTEICPGLQPAGGILGEYFNNMTLAGNPVGTRVDGPIDFLWNQSASGVAGVNADQFSIRWNGRLRATVTGNYQFQTRSDDGVRLWVNDQLIIDQWNDHSATDHTSANVYLVSGQVYPIRLEYYERLVDAEIRLRWRVPGTASFAPIPRGTAPVLDAGLYYCPTAPSVSHYAISHSGVGITCEAEPIIITAMDSNNNPVIPPASTTAVLATTPATGVWVGGNSYTFTGTETSFIKYLQQLTPATLNIHVNDGSTTEIASADPNIVFSDAGLRFYNGASLQPLQNQVAGVANNNPILRAVQTDAETGACESRVAGARSVRLGYECRNPATCSAGQNFTVNSASIAANNNGAITNYADVNLTFNAAGVANIPLNFTDVGAVRLHAVMSLAAQGNDPPFILTGSSNEFVVKPHTLVVSAVTNNPGTTNAGAGFVAAGENFSVYVESRNANGNRTPNFGRESSSELTSVALSVDELVYPVGGTEGTLTGATMGSFTATNPAGTMVNNSVSWDEAGTIRLRPYLVDNDYLGAGDLVVLTPSNPVGRFYPHHFKLAFAETNNSCGSFSYLSGPGIELNYMVEARSVTGSTTTNYASAIYQGTAESQYHAEQGNMLTFNDRISVSPVPINERWINGVMDFNTANPQRNLSLTRKDDSALRDQPFSGAPEGPFSSVQLGLSFINEIDNRQLHALDLNMNATTTGNCVVENNCNAASLGDSLSMLYGRMNIKDAFGSEQSALPMFWQTEFWNGANFVLNTADSCTALAIGRVNFPGSSASINVAGDTITVNRDGISSIFNFGDPDAADGIGDGLTATAIQFLHGRAGIQYGAPGAQVTYPIGIDLTDLLHLAYDWNQDGDYADSLIPLIEVRFSNYRGHDRIIYWREDFR